MKCEYPPHRVQALHHPNIVSLCIFFLSISLLTPSLFVTIRLSSRTDGDRLDLDTILDMGVGRIVGVLVRKDILVAEGVDEGGTAFV